MSRLWSWILLKQNRTTQKAIEKLLTGQMGETDVDCAFHDTSTILLWYSHFLWCPNGAPRLLWTFFGNWKFLLLWHVYCVFACRFFIRPLFDTCFVCQALKWCKLITIFFAQSYFLCGDKGEICLNVPSLFVVAVLFQHFTISNGSMSCSFARSKMAVTKLCFHWQNISINLFNIFPLTLKKKMRQLFLPLCFNELRAPFAIDTLKQVPPKEHGCPWIRIRNGQLLASVPTAARAQYKWKRLQNRSWYFFILV